jgi:hypothetical protein
VSDRPPPAPSGWPTPERWEALLRGDGFPLCADVVADERPPRHGYFVADLPASRLLTPARTVDDER